MLAALWRIRRQWQVGINLTQEKPGACIRVDQHGVFGDPAHPRPFGNGPLQYRRTVHKGPVATATRHFLNAFGQVGQAFADKLVVIPPQRIARNIGLFR